MNPTPSSSAPAEGAPAIPAALDAIVQRAATNPAPTGIGFMGTLPSICEAFSVAAAHSTGTDGASLAELLDSVVAVGAAALQWSNLLSPGTAPSIPRRAAAAMESQRATVGADHSPGVWLGIVGVTLGPIAIGVATRPFNLGVFGESLQSMVVVTALWIEAINDQLARGVTQ